MSEMGMFKLVAICEVILSYSEHSDPVIFIK